MIYPLDKPWDNQFILDDAHDTEIKTDMQTISHTYSPETFGSLLDKAN
jgi:hypothetical protein